MNPSELAESLSLFRSYWSFSARHQRAGEVFEMPGGVGIANGNISWALLNTAFLTEPPTGGAAAWGDRVRRIRDYFRGHGRSWMLAACTDWLTEEDRAALGREGLKHGMSVTGMVAERLLPTKQPLPVEGKEIEYRRIGDEATRQAVADINAQCYHVPIEWGRESISVPGAWTGEHFGYVGYVDNRPATTATALLLDGLLYVALVATLPEYRRRGLAEAVMRKALTEAGRAHGVERTVLHASDMGFPVYRDMGYRTVRKFDLYGEAEAGAGG
ncbi:MAG TPA: GNAT family N-acetyltransferase [Polyangia bacterium]|jgi:ribosomal protein S18 acetylase RimI-like enzyme|nr:GNAT family N-acetyltransferase [Polyangia bacterium]